MLCCLFIIHHMLGWPCNRLPKSIPHGFFVPVWAKQQSIPFHYRVDNNFIAFIAKCSTSYTCCGDSCLDSSLSHMFIGPHNRKYITFFHPLRVFSVGLQLAYGISHGHHGHQKGCAPLSRTQPHYLHCEPSTMFHSNNKIVSICTKEIIKETVNIVSLKQ